MASPRKILGPVAAPLVRFPPLTRILLGLILAPLLLLALNFSAPLGISPAWGAKDVIPGPVPARIVSVIDGDTLVMRARVWLGQEVETRVRLDGVDAPELGRSKCDKERALAVKAKDFVGAWVKGRAVTLSAIQYGKYAGRVVARVKTAAGEDLGAALIQAGLARAYNGGKRKSWCGA